MLGVPVAVSAATAERSSADPLRPSRGHRDRRHDGPRDRPRAAAAGKAAEAAGQLKAVVIVGRAAAQSSNNAAGKAIADVAASYGMDVRRIFHPYATWSKVLANIQGASIVVYLGHGNGWPSPYSPYQEDTKDGLGLNASSGSSTVKYWGATPIAKSIDLAPNAVVLLNHLCYASGNSEPGRLSRASRRPSSGWITTRTASSAPALAPSLYGHRDVSSIIRSLMTTHQTMDEIFMGTGYKGGRDIRFRAPGLRLRRAHGSRGSTGYYRSLVGKLDDGQGRDRALFARTDLVPKSFIVPAWDGSTRRSPRTFDAPGGSVVAPSIRVRWSTSARAPSPGQTAAPISASARRPRASSPSISWTRRTRPVLGPGRSSPTRWPSRRTAMARSMRWGSM